MSASNVNTDFPHTEIVFIDGSLSDIDQLVGAVKPGTEVVVLDPAQDGLLQIAQALAGRSGIDAIHVLSHGSAGALDLGSAHVTQGSLADYGDALGTIRSALAADADLLLYGCDVAQGAQGHSFIEALAAATGADVAASTDLTGSALLGGNWELEAMVGLVGTASLGSGGALAAYGGVLTPVSTGTTIHFEPADGTDMGMVIADGEYGSTDISGLVIQMYRGDSEGEMTDTSLTYSDGYDVLGDTDNGDPMFVIKEKNGQGFWFKGIVLNDWLNTGVGVRIEGFKNGQSTGFIVVDLPSVSTEEPFAPRPYEVTADELTTEYFQDVDTVHISLDPSVPATQGAPTNGNLYLSYNDIVIGTDASSGGGDTTAPTVSSIEYVTSVTGVTNADELVYKLTFSEDVQGVDSTAFTVSGLTGSSIAVTSVDGSTYTVKVSGGNLAGYNGNVTLGFASNQDISDTAGNALDASATPAINQVMYTVDNNAPTVASIVRNAADPTNADSVTWTVTFSESVDDIDKTDFSVSGTTATVTNLTGSGKTYQVTVSGGDLDNLDGAVTLGFAGGQDIVDGAGNALASTTPTGTNQPTYALDNTAPSFLSATVNGATLVLNYSEALDSASTPSLMDFTVDVGGTSATIDNVVVDGANGTVTLTLGTAVLAGQSVSVTYTDPASGGSGAPIQDAAGNDAQVLLATSVTNYTVSTNHAPTIADNISTSVRTGTASALPDYKVADADNDNLTVTLTATNGTIDGLVDADGNPANGIQLQGTAAVINAALADATFTATHNGTASVTLSVTDGKGGSPVTATSYLAATSPAADISDGVVAGATLGVDNFTSLLSGADGNIYMAVPSGDQSTVSIFKWDGSAWSQAVTLHADDVGFESIGQDVPIGVDQYGKFHALVRSGDGTTKVASYDGTAWTATTIETAGQSAGFKLSGASIVVTSDNVVNISYHHSVDPTTQDGPNYFVSNASGTFGPVDQASGDPGTTHTLQQIVGENGHSYVIQQDTVHHTLVIKDYLLGVQVGQDEVPGLAASLSFVGATTDADGAVKIVTVDDSSNVLQLWEKSSGNWTSTPVIEPGDPSHWYVPLNRVATDDATGKPGLVRGLDGKIYLAVWETDAVNNFYGNRILTLEEGHWVDGMAGIAEFDNQLSPTFAVDASGNLMIADAQSFGDVAYVFGHSSDFQAVPPADTTAPSFLSAVIDGGTLTLTYDEALDAAHLPTADAFAVKVDNAAVTVTGVAIGADGKSVVLALSTPALQGQAVTVAYTNASGNDVNAIQDAAGNDAATLPVTAAAENTAPFQGVGALFTFDTASGAGAGTLAGVDMTSHHATYDHNASQVRLNIQTADSTAEDFAYFMNGDTSSLASGNGLYVGFWESETSVRYSLSDFGADTGDYSFDLKSLRLYNDRAEVKTFRITANNGQFQDIVLDAAPQNAYLTTAYALDAAKFSGITSFTVTSLTDTDPVLDGNQSVYIIDNIVMDNITAVDMLAPTLASAAVNGTSLVLTYNEALDITQQLTGGEFTVKVGNDIVTVTGAVVNNDKTVTLTLATAVQPGDQVKVSYQVPANGGVVQDAAGNDAAAVTDATVTNNSLDTLAPTLASAAINGTSLVLTYNEALDITQQLTGGEFTVKVGNDIVTVTGAVVNNDKTVTLTLATAVQPGDQVKVSYQVPANGGVVQDAAGNDAAVVTDATVTNNSLDTLAPTLSSAVVTGTSLVLTYSEALDENAPAAGSFSVNVGGSPVAVTNVAVDPGTGKVTLTLASAVQPNQSVTVSYADASSGETPIQDAAGNDAANLVNQVVTNNSGDTLAPTLSSAVVTGTSLVLTYSEALDENAPAAGSFTVNVGGSPVAVTNVAVDPGTGKVTLTLASAVQPNQSVTVSYADASSGETPIQDAAGNDAANLVNQVVTNNSGDTLAPTLSSAVVTGTSLVLTYSEALDSHAPLAGSFAVNVDGVSVAVTNVAVDADTGKVTLTLASAVQPNQAVKVSYGDTSGGVTPIQDISGNDAAGLLGQEVSNHSTDTLAPTFVAAAVNGRTLVMTYSEALDAGHGPAGSAFTVNVGGNQVAVSSVAIDAASKTVTLTLASSVQNGQSVTVSYTDPSDGNDANAIQDAAGNDAASVATRTVTNNTPAVVTPPVVTPPTETTVDGVKVVSEQVTNSDGSTSTRLVIPTVTSSREEQVGNNTVADIPLAQTASGTSILTAQLPVGYGMTSTGSGIKTAGDALTDLIREIKAHTAAGSADQEQLTGGGSGFLGDLASSTNLLVQTIVPTFGGSAAPGESLALTGIPSAPGNPLTAIVLDASSLPAGTSIKLDNVEFAALIGAVNVSGGAGSQKVWGDSASQTIFLGEGDDTLHGGGGNDIVGSAGGNDHVYGDDGDDIVFGGEGDDYVDGGAGYDIARFSGAGRDGYSLRVKDGHLVMTDLHGSDGTDTVVDVEMLRFTGAAADTTVRGTVARLVEAAGGTADTVTVERLVDAVAKGASTASVANGLLSANGLDKVGSAAFVDALYHNVLGRDADAGGKAAWVAALDGGSIDRAGAALMFADSAEKLAQGQTVDLDFNHSDVATLVRMYETLFACHADEGGLNFWIGLHEAGTNLAQLADWFVDSGEAVAQYGALTDAQFVDALYHTAFDRAGTAGEQKFWLDNLASGAIDRGDVLLGFAESEEMVKLVGTIGTSIETA